MLDILKQAALSTRDDVIAVLQYVLAENQVMRSRFENNVPLNQEDRWRLMRMAWDMPKSFDQVIAVAGTKTVRGWGRQRGLSQTQKKTGSPKTDAEIEALVLRIAEESDIPIGASGIHRLNGVPPVGERGYTCWKDFKDRHGDCLWACDFFTAPVQTSRSRVDAYVLAFVHVPTRRIWLSRSTLRPNQEWVTQQTCNMLMWADEHGLEATGLICDRDTKFGTAFKEVLNSCGLEVWRIPPRNPQYNGFAESLVGIIKRECINHFVYESLEDIDRVLAEYVPWYHHHRPHGSLGYAPAATSEPRLVEGAFESSDVVTTRHCVGLLCSYHWRDEAVNRAA